MDRKMEKCPFCNSNEIELIMNYYGFHQESIEYYYTCHNCNLKTPSFETRKKAEDYWNNGIFRTINNKSEVKYDIQNFITYCSFCGNPIEDEIYCPSCGKELIRNIEKEKLFNEEYDKRKVHPYGWPLTKEELLYAIGKPVCFSQGKECKFSWEIINKIEINDNGFNINFDNGIWVLYDKVLLYDPNGIIRDNKFS